MRKAALKKIKRDIDQAEKDYSDKVEARKRARMQVIDNGAGVGF